jgi:hypothetical protein
MRRLENGIFAPEDPKQFAREVAQALRQMKIDGSTTVTARNVCQYNNWRFNSAIACQITNQLRRKLPKATAKAYSLQKVKV